MWCHWCRWVLVTWFTRANNVWLHWHQNAHKSYGLASKWSLNLVSPHSFPLYRKECPWYSIKKLNFTAPFGFLNNTRVSKLWYIFIIFNISNNEPEKLYSYVRKTKALFKWMNDCINKYWPVFQSYTHTKTEIKNLLSNFQSPTK